MFRGQANSIRQPSASDSKTDPRDRLLFQELKQVFQLTQALGVKEFDLEKAIIGMLQNQMFKPRHDTVESSTYQKPIKSGLSTIANSKTNPKDHPLFQLKQAFEAKEFDAKKIIGILQDQMFKPRHDTVEPNTYQKPIKSWLPTIQKMEWLPIWVDVICSNDGPFAEFLPLFLYAKIIPPYELLSAGKDAKSFINSYRQFLIDQLKIARSEILRKSLTDQTKSMSDEILRRGLEVRANALAGTFDLCIEYLKLSHWSFPITKNKVIAIMKQLILALGEEQLKKSYKISDCLFHLIRDHCFVDSVLKTMLEVLTRSNDRLEDVRGTTYDGSSKPRQLSPFEYLCLKSSNFSHQDFEAIVNMLMDAGYNPIDDLARGNIEDAVIDEARSKYITATHQRYLDSQLVPVLSRFVNGDPGRLVAGFLLFQPAAPTASVSSSATPTHNKKEW